MCSDRLSGTATNDGCGNPLVRRLLVPGSNSRPIINEYALKYKKYSTEFAKKYLNVEKYRKFNDSFTNSNKDISGGSSNMSFETYAKNKLNTLRS